MVIPHQPSTNKISRNICTKLLVTPVIDMFRCLFKKRDKGLHWLIAIQIFLFITYWFVVYETAEMRYLYMLKTFDGYSGADYSYYNAYCCILTVFGLLFIQPLMISYDGLHDALYISICLGSETISNYLYYLPIYLCIKLSYSRFF